MIGCTCNKRLVSLSRLATARKRASSFSRFKLCWRAARKSTNSTLCLIESHSWRDQTFSEKKPQCTTSHLRVWGLACRATDKYLLYHARPIPMLLSHCLPRNSKECWEKLTLEGGEGLFLQLTRPS